MNIFDSLNSLATDLTKRKLWVFFSTYRCVGKELYIKKEITQNESGHFERSSKLFLPTKGSSPKNHMVKILGIQKKGDIHQCRGFTLPPSFSCPPLKSRISNVTTVLRRNQSCQTEPGRAQSELLGLWSNTLYSIQEK